MSRKRLDHEVNELFDNLSPSQDSKEKSRARYEEANKKGTFTRKLNEHIKQLGNDYFSSMHELFYKECEKEHLAGDTKAFMKCIDFCCTNKLVIPNWAAEAFHEGYTKINNYEARSWDVVFGKPNKGKHLKEQRCDEDKQLIHKCVRELINQGHPVAAGLFETVGKRFGSKGREIRDIYYDHEHQRIEQLHSLYKGMEVVDKALKKAGLKKPK